MNYKIIIPGLFLLSVFTLLSGQDITETRNFIKSFPVNRESTLDVTNKYGTVQVTTWKKDSALVRAEIKAFATNQSKISSLFDGIDIDLSDAGPVIKARTVFTQNVNRFFESFKGMTSKLISYDSRVEINYFITVPEYLNLRIDNRYGDLYMESCAGNFYLYLSNGSLKANDIGKNSEITLTFCDAEINSVAAGSFDASFSEITAERFGKLSITSISSRFDVKQADELRLDSKRDKFYIDNTASISGVSYFTDFTIKKLTKELELDTKYGNIIAEEISRKFDAVNLKSGFGDIHLAFEENSTYKIDIRHTSGYLSLPVKNIKTEQKTLDEEKKEFLTYGTAGSNPGTSLLKIEANRSKIFIK